MSLFFAVGGVFLGTAAYVMLAIALAGLS